MRRALLALALAACAAPVAAPTARPTVEPTATEPAANPTLARTPPANTPAPKWDLASLVRPLVRTWRPLGPFLVLNEWRGASGYRVVAVPDEAAAVPLLEYHGAEWDVARDGSVVLAVADGDSPRRLALWDAATGATRWLTDPEDGVSHDAPRWSADGASVLFAANGRAPRKTIERIRRDGGGREILVTDDNLLGLWLRGTTPTGEIVWSKLFLEGSSIEILDQRTGANRTFQRPGRFGPAYVAAWRAAAPRALVVRHGGGVGDSSLVLWDDVGGADRVLFGPGETVLGASWDPAGARAVVAVAGRDGSAPRLRAIDASGTLGADLAGSEGATEPVWIDTGVAFLFRPPPPADSATELRLVPAGGGTARTLLRGMASGFGQLRRVRP